MFTHSPKNQLGHLLAGATVSEGFGVLLVWQTVALLLFGVRQRESNSATVRQFGNDKQL